MEDSYSRFSQVVKNYVLYRPRYPAQIIGLLQSECGLRVEHAVADIGAGTGQLTELFLKNGNRVYAVEPNPEMRAAASDLMSAYPLFTAVDGTAEITTLPDHSVYIVAAAQAFHWFRVEETRREFLRILMPQGWVVLVWNLLRNRGTAFADVFEPFWKKYVNPAENFGPRQRPEAITRFFYEGLVWEASMDNHQVCDFERLKGRVLSSSHAPQQGHPQYEAMLDELAAIFEQHQQDGTITLEYDTRVVYGRLAP